MNRRGAGVSFCLIAALLFSARYLSAAIFGSGVASWNLEVSRAMLSHTGNGLTIASIISLLTGIFYLAWAEVTESGEK